MLEDAVVALEVMHTLKQLGIRIAMDDFGTGYSSLSYLRAFPFDGLKIDRSFLTRLEDEGDMAIVQAVIGLGRAPEHSAVTAEGIETAEHLAMLKARGLRRGTRVTSSVAPWISMSSLNLLMDGTSEPIRRTNARRSVGQFYARGVMRYLKK